MQLSLYVRRGPTSGQIHPLHESRVTLLGRSSSNHIVLLDRGVSANHAVIRPRRSRPGFVLLDARSRHGTAVNGQRITKAAVGLGDLVTMGPFELEVIETPAGEYPVQPKRPAADRSARFEIASRGWGRKGEPLPPGSVTVIGRSRVAHLTVRDTFVSTCHCLICLDATDDGRMPFVIDLHSSNGTCINRRPVHRKHLLPGDVLMVGDQEFKLRRVKGAVVEAVEPEVEIPPAPPRRPGASTTLVPDHRPLDLAEPVAADPIIFAPEPEDEPAEAELRGQRSEVSGQRSAASIQHPASSIQHPERVAPDELEPLDALEEVLAPVDGASEEDLIDVFDDVELGGVAEELAEEAPAPSAEALEPAPADVPAGEPEPSEEPVVSIETPAEAEPITTETAKFAPAPGSRAAAFEERETAAFVREPAPAPEPAAPEPTPAVAEEPEPVGVEAEEPEPERVVPEPMPVEAEEPVPAMALAEASADAAVAAALEDTCALEVVTLPQVPMPSFEAPRLLAEAPDDYGEFFGFERPPFAPAPDPDCFFDGQHHWDALDTLVRWLKTGPPVAVLFGERGCGKSLLVECLARRLAYRRPTPVVVCPSLGDTLPHEIIGAALAQAREVYADLPEGGDDPAAAWEATVQEIHRRKGLVAFLLDDAHLAREDDLRAMADLLDSDAARGVVRILLAGDESLRELVGEPPLAYHLGFSCYLQPLTDDEVAPYLALRIFNASGRRELPFTRRAVDLIAEYSCGIPRVINLVADAALRQALREHRPQADFQTVARAIRQALGADAPPSTA